ncbi:MAG: heavy metal translocating P-type ATPase [Magnetococcales bacterium]|nr:heavy metal translocating P-type ATPase [Magnetococcales bacterium]
MLSTEVAGDGEWLLFRIDKMDCPVEEQLIRKKLSQSEGVLQLHFNLMQNQLTVLHQGSSWAKIAADLAAIGLPPAPETGTDQAARAAVAKRPAIATRRWLLMALAGLTAVAAEVLVWLGQPERGLPVVAFSLLAILFGGLETLKKGYIALRNFALNIHFLMSIAVLGAVAIGQWPEAAMVIFLFGVAEMIETLSLDRARNAVRTLMTLAPDNATVRDAGGQWQTREVRDIRIGQLLRIKPGERIPLDGMVVAGHSSVNQSPITGESVPVTKQVGDMLFAGTINERGVLECRVTADRDHTTLARIIASVQDAQSQRAPTQRFVDQFAAWYTPTVVFLASLVAIIPPLLALGAFTDWLYNALVLLVVACPCALVISTPVTIVSGLAAAARRGILIKGGIYLEEGHRLKALAMDKTGTLTCGQLSLTDIIPLSEHGEEALLRLAAGLEAHSEHPMATAILAAWHGSAPLPTVTAFESLTGQGVQGVIAGERYFIGSHRLIETLGLCTPATEAHLFRLEQESKTVVILASSTATLAIFAASDQVREQAAAAVAALDRLGVHVVMLTGDNRTTAAAIAARTGIEAVEAELLPVQKLASVERLLHRYGRVGMVGDGINDAPAMARASIGFAMGTAGTDTALETADVALMNDDLGKLAEFIRLSRRTNRILRQNIAFALVLKGIVFLLALAGMATLWMAVFADMGASLLVIFNGMRILRFSTDH